METQKTIDIAIKNFTGRIPLKGELLATLKNEDLVFLHRKKNEAHVMKKSRYMEILQEAKTQSGYSDIQLNRTKKGRDHMRKLCSFVCPVSVRKEYLSLSGDFLMKKRLEGQDISVKIFL